MDKPLAIQEKKTTKPRHRQNPQKSKKKQQDPQAPNAPVKVVYIGNPVNFSTSASEFRSLVQQLTGKHSCSSDNSVGGRELVQESAVEARHPQNLGGAEAEEIASSSSLNCPPATSDHNTNSFDVGHRALHGDDFYNMPDQMLDDYLPDFWNDRY